MKVIVPITGELIGSDAGNPDDPVRPINLVKLLPVELTDFAWQAINYDFDAGLVELEVTFEPQIIETDWDGKSNPIAWREETQIELATRQTNTEEALRQILQDHTRDELHQMSGSPKLKRKEVKK